MAGVFVLGCAFDALDSCESRNDGEDCCGVLGMVALGTLDSCPCFLMGDVLSQG